MCARYWLWGVVRLEHRFVCVRMCRAAQVDGIFGWVELCEHYTLRAMLHALSDDPNYLVYESFQDMPCNCGNVVVSLTCESVHGDVHRKCSNGWNKTWLS
eukprot:3790793-Amphidinium_carterae.1